MNCKEVRESISSLVDHELDIDLEEKVLNHIENCDECRKIYEEEKMIKEVTNNIELEELPLNFEKKLHYRLEEEKKEMKSKNKVVRLFNKNRKYFAIAAVFIFGVVLFNNINLDLKDGSFYEEAKEMAVSDEAVMEAEMNTASVLTEEAAPSVKMKGDSISPSQFTVAENKKSDYQQGRVIIKTGNLEIEILDLDLTIDKVEKKLNEFDGYVSNYNSRIRYINDNGKEFKNGFIEVKVDSKSFEKFIDYVESLGRVVNTNSSSKDITNSYRDTVSSIKNLEITQDRLREILKKSESVKETLEVERELTRIRGQLDSLKGNIKRWDRLSQYATISISLNEVEELDVKIKPIDKNIFQKSKEGLMKTINKIKRLFEIIFISMVAYSPIIISIGLLIILVLRYFKRRGK